MYCGKCKTRKNTIIREVNGEYGKVQQHLCASCRTLLREKPMLAVPKMKRTNYRKRGG